MDEKTRAKLSDEQYRVLVEKGTERPFTGDYLDHKEEGKYHCAACGNPLFDSDTKFDSGSGWPSFYDVVDQGNVALIRDSSLGMIRTEVVCANCGGHLGHVFDDGPSEKTGQRYCINSVSLDFKK
ncbi:MAG: peptide-methionine (R)-S-oxide reductase MsrB [Vicingaceae bacterium]